MAKYSSEQQQVIDTVRRIARKKGASPKELKAALKTVLVESNARNLNYGDRDSQGAFQQRPSQGWGRPGNVAEDAAQFFNRARQYRGRGGSSGQLAQNVQRSAFPDRYDQKEQQVREILHQKGGPGMGQMSSVPGKPAVDNSPIRELLAQKFLSERGRPGAMLAFAAGIHQAQDTPAIKRSGADGNPNEGGVRNKDIIGIGKEAQKMGLHVGENSYFDGKKPTGGHAPNSYHYKDRAIDVSSPDTEKMKKFANLVKRRYGRSLKELFWNGPGAANIKNGRPEPKGFVGGHTDHVHIAK